MAGLSASASAALAATEGIGPSTRGLVVLQGVESLVPDTRRGIASTASLASSSASPGALSQLVTQGTLAALSAALLGQIGAKGVHCAVLSASAGSAAARSTFACQRLIIDRQGQAFRGQQGDKGGEFSYHWLVIPFVQLVTGTGVDFQRDPNSCGYRRCLLLDLAQQLLVAFGRIIDGGDVAVGAAAEIVLLLLLESLLFFDGRHRIPVGEPLVSIEELDVQ